jgi:hypothetical protein
MCRDPAKEEGLGGPGRHIWVVPCITGHALDFPFGYGMSSGPITHFAALQSSTGSTASSFTAKTI